jgi:hypothetical protein
MSKTYISHKPPYWMLSDIIGLLYLLTECSSGYNWNILKYIQFTEEEDPLVSHTHEVYQLHKSSKWQTINKFVLPGENINSMLNYI